MQGGSSASTSSPSGAGPASSHESPSPIAGPKFFRELDTNVGLFAKDRARSCLTQMKHIYTAEIGRVPGRESPIGFGVQPGITTPSPIAYLLNWNQIELAPKCAVYYKGMVGREKEGKKKEIINSYNPNFRMIDKNVPKINFSSVVSRSAPVFFSPSPDIRNIGRKVKTITEADEETEEQKAQKAMEKLMASYGSGGSALQTLSQAPESSSPPESPISVVAPPLPWSTGMVEMKRTTGREQCVYFAGSIPTFPLQNTTRRRRRKGGAKGSSSGNQTDSASMMSASKKSGGGGGPAQAGSNAGGEDSTEQFLNRFSKLLDSYERGRDPKAQQSQQGKSHHIPAEGSMSAYGSVDGSDGLGKSGGPSTFVWESPQQLARREKERKRKLKGMDFGAATGRQREPFFLEPLPMGMTFIGTTGNPMEDEPEHDLARDKFYDVKYKAVDGQWLAWATKWGDKMGSSLKTMRSANVDTLRHMISNSVRKGGPRTIPPLSYEQASKPIRKKHVGKPGPDIFLTTGRDEQYAYSMKTLMYSCEPFCRNTRRPPTITYDAPTVNTCLPPVTTKSKSVEPKSAKKPVIETALSPKAQSSGLPSPSATLDPIRAKPTATLSHFLPKANELTKGAKKGGTNFSERDSVPAKPRVDAKV